MEEIISFDEHIKIIKIVETLKKHRKEELSFSARILHDPKEDEYYFEDKLVPNNWVLMLIQLQVILYKGAYKYNKGLDEYVISVACSISPN